MLGGAIWKLPVGKSNFEAIGHWTTRRLYEEWLLDFRGDHRLS